MGNTSRIRSSSYILWMYSIQVGWATELLIMQSFRRTHGVTVRNQEKRLLFRAFFFEWNFYPLIDVDITGHIKNIFTVTL